MQYKIVQGNNSLPIIDRGCADISVGQNANTYIPFNKTFTQIPIVFADTINFGSSDVTVKVMNVTNTGFNVMGICGYGGGVSIQWIAIL